MNDIYECSEIPEELKNILSGTADKLKYYFLYIHSYHLDKLITLYNAKELHVTSPALIYSKKQRFFTFVIDKDMYKFDYFTKKWFFSSSIFPYRNAICINDLMSTDYLNILNETCTYVYEFMYSWPLLYKLFNLRKFKRDAI